MPLPDGAQLSSPLFPEFHVLYSYSDFLQKLYQCRTFSLTPNWMLYAAMKCLRCSDIMVSRCRERLCNVIVHVYLFECLLLVGRPVTSLECITIMIKLCYVLMYPYLTYCNAIWGAASESSLKKILTLQKIGCMSNYAFLDLSSPLFKQIIIRLKISTK